MQIDTAKLRVSTKGLIAAVFAAGTFLQIPQVNAVATKYLSAHPRLSPVVVTIGTIWALLHNPQVQDALGIKKTVEVKETTEEVTLAKPDAEK